MMLLATCVRRSRSSRAGCQSFPLTSRSRRQAGLPNRRSPMRKSSAWPSARLMSLKGQRPSENANVEREEMPSIVEPHHRKLVAQIPREQYRAYLEEFVALFCLQNGAAGLISRFPGLAPFYEDPPLGPPKTAAWSFPASKPGEVVLGSPKPHDRETAPR